MKEILEGILATFRGLISERIEDQTVDFPVLQVAHGILDGITDVRQERMSGGMVERCVDVAAQKNMEKCAVDSAHRSWRKSWSWADHTGVRPEWYGGAVRGSRTWWRSLKGSGLSPGS